MEVTGASPPQPFGQQGHSPHGVGTYMYDLSLITVLSLHVYAVLEIVSEYVDFGVVLDI